MPFASRQDLLDRTNAQRLVQLAVPADYELPPANSLRKVIEAPVLADVLPKFNQADQAALTAALTVIDNALTDANALILSYGIPDGIQTTLLARLTSTIALYYLQGDERLTEEVTEAYKNALAILKRHQRGEIDLTPADPNGVIPDDSQTIEISASSSRYAVVVDDALADGFD